MPILNNYQKLLATLDPRAILMCFIKMVSFNLENIFKTFLTNTSKACSCPTWSMGLYRDHHTNRYKTTEWVLIPRYFALSVVFQGQIFKWTLKMQCFIFFFTYRAAIKDRPWFNYVEIKLIKTRSTTPHSWPNVNLVTWTRVWGPTRPWVSHSEE